MDTRPALIRQLIKYLLHIAFSRNCHLKTRIGVALAQSGITAVNISDAN